MQIITDDVSSEWDASITIEDDRSVGDVVFTFPYNGGDPSGDDMHLCEDSAYFEINPRNRSELSLYFLNSKEIIGHKCEQSSEICIQSK